MRNPINHNKLLLQISLFLGIAHYLINMYLYSHIAIRRRIIIAAARSEAEAECQGSETDEILKNLHCFIILLNVYN
jgi:hypothetical protein